MRLKILDADTREMLIYNIYWDRIRRTLSAYEKLYIMDDDVLDSLAIESAVKYFFGNDYFFQRDTNIRDYIYGYISNKNGVIRNVFIFFES